MPFTLAHPAAVLPFARRPLSTAGLVAGAIAPDLPYFARAVPVPVTAQSWYEPYLNATTSHGMAGSLTVSLPYAVLLAAIWYAARRPAASLLAPDPSTTGAATWRAVNPAGDVRSRASVGLTTVPLAFLVGIAWLLLSLLIGIATHLLWDSLTHGVGNVVAHTGKLSDPAVGSLTWARLFQHVSTVVGLVIVALYLWRRGSGLRVRAAAVVTVLVVAVGGGVAGGLAQWQGANDGAPVSVEHLLRSGAEVAGITVLASMLLYIAGWWAVRMFRGPQRAVHARTRGKDMPFG